MCDFAVVTGRSGSTVVRWSSRVAILVMISQLVACGADHATAAGTGNPTDTGFVFTGDPESTSGATWAFHGTMNGETYDLTGTLLKPHGAGPFPAVVLSHGSEGNAQLFSSLVGTTMVQWGLVCIATNYTHSAGAYLDVATVSAYPSDFRVASHTGGGVRPAQIVVGPAPSPTQAAGIRIPFQMHHGDADATVPLSYDVRLDSLLAATGVERQLCVYAGEDHLQVRTDATALGRIRAWYAAHGMF